MPLPATILRGLRLQVLDGKNAGRFLGATYRNTIIRVVNAICNLRVMVQKPDGSTAEADVKMTEMGTVLTFPKEAFSNVSNGGGSASVQQFKIVSDGGDYWNCKTWDGKTLGSTVVKVAKPYKLRAGIGKIASEVIRGVTYTYTYTAVTSGGVTIYYTRAVSGSDGTSETDFVIPDALTNDIIYGITFSTTAPSSLSDVVWLDINADGRAWAK